jgi:hypothetical protein
MHITTKYTFSWNDRIFLCAWDVHNYSLLESQINIIVNGVVVFFNIRLLCRMMYVWVMCRWAWATICRLCNVLCCFLHLIWAINCFRALLWHCVCCRSLLKDTSKIERKVLYEISKILKNHITYVQLRQNNVRCETYFSCHRNQPQWRVQHHLKWVRAVLFEINHWLTL